MVYVLIEHLVGDYETFKTVYLDDLERRKPSGSKGATVMRVSGDPKSIIILMDTEA